MGFFPPFAFFRCRTVLPETKSEKPVFFRPAFRRGLFFLICFYLNASFCRGQSLSFSTRDGDSDFPLFRTAAGKSVNKAEASFSLKAEPVNETGWIRYQVYYQDVPVYQARAVCLMDKEQKKRQWLTPNFNHESLSLKSTARLEKNPDPVWIEKDGEWYLARKSARASGQGKTEAVLDFVLPGGEVLFSEDWLMLSGGDSLIKARVFIPDPIAGLNANYGGLLRDRGDSNSVLLSLALDTVMLRVGFQNDTFRLKNQYFQFGEFSDPVRLRSTSVLPQFLFYRNEPQFEEVNAFYHLNAFRRFTDSLGFSSLASYPLKVDAHGMDGADVSAYSPLQDVLAFGDGNVDDGEDAAVVVHEYGHALMQSAIPFGNSGQERKAVEEGICDYLAGSYVKSCSSWQWQNLFKWDGHNEFWPGRNLLSNKVYPFSLQGQIHRDGEIFSSFLMHVELLMGRAATHRVLLSVAPFFVANLSMPQAAVLFQKMDSTLFGTQHYNLITQAMLDRGLHPSQIIVSVPEKRKDTTLPIEIQQLESGYLILNHSPGQVRLSMRDTNGRPVLYLPDLPSGTSHIISPAGIAAGIYLLKYESESGAGVEKLALLPR
jgi:hypothetical protein